MTAASTTTANSASLQTKDKEVVAIEEYKVAPSTAAAMEAASSKHHQQPEKTIAKVEEEKKEEEAVPLASSSITEVQKEQQQAFNGEEQLPKMKGQEKAIDLRQPQQEQHELAGSKKAYESDNEEYAEEHDMALWQHSMMNRIDSYKEYSIESTKYWWKAFGGSKRSANTS